MKKSYFKGGTVTFLLIFLFFSQIAFSQSFSQSLLDFNGQGNVSNGVTSMMFGPDGRLYVAEYPGQIKILTLDRVSSTDYTVIDIEVLNGVSNIPNHDDDGAACSGAPVNCNSRETIGLTVVGTALNPIVYVTSSDFRIGAGSGGGNGDVDLDTNSGIITRFTWNGSSWDVVDIVRGLPRSEENHATNGLEFATINEVDYLIVASGGHTNAGGPSVNFVYQCEYALSGAILSVNLDMLENMPILNDNGRSYIYDLPTLDDPTRPNANGITDPNTPGYNGIDVNDPWGGNDGLNQAIVDPLGPVQIYSPGYRNSYDIVLTSNGALYATDNGANGGWGGFPENEGGGSATNNYLPNEPGSQSPSGGEQIDNFDHLQLITTNIQTYATGSYYGGHPNPTRANPNGAGLFTEIAGSQVFRTQKYDPNGSTPGSTSNANVALPANWPPVQVANVVEGDWRGPTVTNPDGPEDNPIVVWGTNTNGIDEYTASNFGGAMQGDLLAGHSAGLVRRVQLNPNGTSQGLTNNFLSGIGGNALGITCNGDTDIFPGTVWVGTLEGNITVFEPQDFVNCLEPGDSGYDPLADGDFDGYQNQDEADNGTQTCNGGSQPDDFDRLAGAPLISNLNDSDDDADGIPDAIDPFQLGNPTSGGSDAFTLPIFNDLFNSQQGLGGIFGLGMTGLMNNGNTGSNWLDWLDVKGVGPNPDDVLGGAPGIMTSHMTDGTALGSANNQDKGYQYGVQVDNSTGLFTVTGGMNGFTGPLRLYGNTNGITNGELGFFIGDGTQSNYIKFVVTTDGFMALQEINDVPGQPIQFTLPVGNRPTSGILFHFVVNPSTGTVNLEYQIDNNSRTSLGSIVALGNVLQAIQTSGTELAVGFIGSSNTVGKELEGSWDFLNVKKTIPASDVVARVNASGNLVSDPSTGVDWQANQANGSTSGTGYSVNTGWGFPSNLLYSNRHQSISPEMDQATFEALFANERYDLPSNPEMEYSFPVPNDDYVVKIYAGNSFSGTNQAGQRVFDIMIEGQVLGDDIDLVSLFGHQSGGVLSYQTQVQDGELNVQFIHGVENPLLNAIEIARVSVQEIPISVNPIADQSNTLGQVLDGSLAVTASGGDGSLTYSANGLPPGVSINSTNGQISGTIANNASTVQPYTVTVIVDDTDANPNDIVQVNFSWQISEAPNLSVVARVNASGILVTDPAVGVDWQANQANGSTSGPGYSVNTGQGFGSNLLYTNRHSSIPPEMDQATFEALFANERYDLPSNPEMEYSFPVPNDDYVVKIYAGNSFSGTSQAGQRVFDIMIEGQVLGDDIDLVSLFGHQSGGVLSYQTQVQDGELNVQFIHGVENPLLNAIEVLASSIAQNPITVQSIADQNNNEGDVLDGSLGVVASGGDGNFTFSISGQPSGVFIEPTNGQIGGSIDVGTATGSPYAVTIVVDDSDADTSDAVTVNFNWTVTNNSLVWTVKNENENYTARHECSFVQAGDKFYLMGGRENAQTIDVYDYGSNSWNQLTNSSPVEFNHFQALEYQGLIWVIGAFRTNDFPNEIPADYVWAFDPSTNQWIQGPEIPTGRKRGSAGLAIHDGKLYVIGGNTDGHNGGYVPWFDQYDPTTGIWTPLFDAPRARDHFHAAVINDKLYMAGGRLTGGPGGVFAPTIGEVDVYDFATNTWSTLPSGQNLPTERAGTATVNFQDKLLVIGGEGGGQAFDLTEQYDPVTQSWQTLDNLNYARQGTQAITSGNGVYIIGGSPNQGGGNQKNMEFLGTDSATGTPSVSSVLGGPSSVSINDNSSVNLTLDVSGGNVGIIINSMELTGPDAQDFSIVSGNLQNALLPPSSNHMVNIALNGSGAGRTAVLNIDYGASLTKVINLSSASTSTEGVISFTLMNADTNAPLFDLLEGQQVNINSLPTTNLNIRANTSPAIVGSVSFNLTGTVTNNRLENGAPYALFGDNSGDYLAGSLPEGNYSLSAMAYNNSGQSGGILGQVNTINFSMTTTGSGGNLPPVAIAIASTQSGTTPLAVDFTGSSSTDDVGVVSYFWDFKDGNTSTSADPSNLFTNPGTYDVELTVTDVENETDTTTVTITVDEPVGNQPPVAIATASTQTGTAPLAVDFTGSNSTDDVGVVSYFWDFKDGNTSSLADPSNTFTNSGTYDVELTVTDGENETDTATVTITVDEPASNQPPVAIATASIESGFTPLTVNFTGSNSTDDVGIVSYFWDFKDGNTSTSADPSNTYTAAGTYDVVLTVTDAENEFDTDIVTITVTEPNTEGVISLTLIDAISDIDLFNLIEGQQINLGSSGGIGLNVRANTTPVSVGSVSFVLTGPVSTTRTEGVAPYALFGDVSGDFNPNDLSLGNYTLTATAYNGAGQSGGTLGQPFVVNFSIVDNGGNNQPPLAVATASIQSGTAPLSVDFTGSNSTDDVGVVSYFWDFKDGNTSTLANPSNTFTVTGTYEVELTVTDGENETDTTTITISVNESSNNQPPIVTNPGTQNNNEGEAVSLQITASDESTNLLYGATNLPPTLTIDANSGVISGILSQGQSSGAFLETSGLVIIEAETDFVDSSPNIGWDIESDGSTTFMEAHANHFSVSELGETVTYDVQVTTPGVYRFHMKSEFSGSVASDENDTWFKIDNTPDIHFFCVSSDLSNTAEFETFLSGGSIGKSVYYPAGNAQSRPDFGADNPGSNGYFKVFRNGDVVGGGNKWSAETIDFHSYAIYAYIPNPTTFTISMSERSAGHRVDRFGMTHIDLQGPGEPTTVLDGPESSRESGGAVGAAENSPYTVEVTVTDDGNPQESTMIQFDWIIGTDGGGSNSNTESVESFVLVNADTDSDLFEITDGMQIQESTIQGLGLNIRANTDPTIVGSVSIDLSGPVNNSRTENGAPYTLFGDSGGDYFATTLAVGNYTLSATPYPNPSLAGTPGQTLTVQFSIISTGNIRLPNDDFLENNISVSLSPNPTNYEVNVVTKPITNIQKVYIFDVAGRLVRTVDIDEYTSDVGQFKFNVLGIEEGIYILQMWSKTTQKVSEHRLIIRN